MVRFFQVLTKEILNTLLLVLGVTALLYLVFNLMPGPFLGKGEGVKGYLLLIKNLFTFHFGTSVVSGRDIGGIVFPAFKNTLVLTLGSMFISTFVSVPIGIFLAFRGFKNFAWPLSIFSYVVSSIPVFYLGYLVLYLVSRYTGFLPIFYPKSIERESMLISYVLPILVLGIGNDAISEIVRLIGNELERVMNTDYVVASKARGESVLKSSLKEGIIIPLVSIIFANIPFLIGGAVIVEHVFNWPGMGRLAFQSTLDRDLPVLIIIAFLSVLIVRAGMLVKEILLFFTIPRES